MRITLTEFIGTFFLVLSIGFITLQQIPVAPIAIGAALMVLVYAGGPLSGAHYNPAVSLAIAMRGAMPWSRLPVYWVSQFVGAFAGALVVHLISGQTFAPTPFALVKPFSATLCEALYTFLLVYVVFRVAVDQKVAGNSYYGLAIGFTVMVAAFAVGAHSGGAFNPAVGFGPIAVKALFGGGGWSDLPIYLIGPSVGAALAALTVRAQDQSA